MNESDRDDYRRNRIGFVYQSFNLIGNLSAINNVLLPYIPIGVTTDAGIFAHSQAEPGLNEALVQKMAQTMAHRGPDDGGIYMNPDQRLGLGFRRLSIIDLSPAGHQPMSNEDGTVWIVFDGEIYNHSEHRPVLISKGHRYRGRSDTETILHLYEEYGEDCVKHLRGMFAFAIWDEKRRRLLLARDRLGIKPLYYSLVNGAFVFGSEIKAIAAVSGRQARDRSRSALPLPDLHDSARAVYHVPRHRKAARRPCHDG